MVIMLNGIIVNNQIIEVSEECMNVIVQIARSMGQNTVTSVPVATPITHETAPVTPKVYEHVTEDFDNFVFVVKDNKVTYTHKDGTYLHEKAVRKVLNARIKAAGGSYVDKCWEFNKGDKRDLAGAKKFVELHSEAVKATELNAIRDEWTAKSAKRASKATK